MRHLGGIENSKLLKKGTRRKTEQQYSSNYLTTTAKLLLATTLEESNPQFAIKNKQNVPSSETPSFCLLLVRYWPIADLGRQPKPQLYQGILFYFTRAHYFL
jgi:hypothetical protein